MLPANLNMIVFQLKEQILKHFTSSEWQDIALITDSLDIVNNHPRLLRSLGFDDDDYGGHITKVLMKIIHRDSTNLQKIHDYVDEKLGDGSNYISTKPSSRRITFAPNVFDVPDLELRDDLVAVMMPFAGFDSVYEAIKGACIDATLDCLRADDIWDESTFVQDIVNLIFQARIVVCDFSTRNPNVFYETGIAHTLGKEVVPIAQSLADIPSDLQHHRALSYLGNTEGLEKLHRELAKRLQTLVSRA